MTHEHISKWERDGDGLLVTFPDFPEAITGGADEREALANAQEALELAIFNHLDAGEPLPPAHDGRALQAGERLIAVSAQGQAKLAFIEAFKQAGTTRVAFAKQLGKGENEVRRMLDPYHATKLASLEAGLAALGRRITLLVEPA